MYKSRTGVLPGVCLPSALETPEQPKSKFLGMQKYVGRNLITFAASPGGIIERV